MPDRKLIKPEGLIVGYAMARLGQRLLGAMGWRTWSEAYEAAGGKLEEKHNSIKLLRDEFDVFFPNGRKGWHYREPNPSRVAVLHEFETVSDAALIEIVQRILTGDASAIEEVVNLVAEPPKRVANVAERLLTGRLAEEHFMLHSQEIIDVHPTKLLDMRQRACGYDFEVPLQARSGSGVPLLPAMIVRRERGLGGEGRSRPIAIEVKGIKASSGGILFTDHEWNEAKIRGADYWLVLVGNLGQEKPEPPKAKVFPDPAAVFADQARVNIVTSTAAEWRMTASL